MRVRLAGELYSINYVINLQAMAKLASSEYPAICTDILLAARQVAISW